MPTVIEKVALAREERDKAERAFRKALRTARSHGMSWPQIATVSGMSIRGVRYLAMDENEQRRQARQEVGNDGA